MVLLPGNWRMQNCPNFWIRSGINIMCALHALHARLKLSDQSVNYRFPNQNSVESVEMKKTLKKTL